MLLLQCATIDLVDIAESVLRESYGQWLWRQSHVPIPIVY